MGTSVFAVAWIGAYVSMHNREDAVIVAGGLVILSARRVAKRR